MHNAILFKATGRSSSKPCVILQPKRKELDLSRLGDVTLGTVAKALFSSDACMVAACAAVLLMWGLSVVGASAMASLKPMLYASPWLALTLARAWRKAATLVNDMEKEGGKA